MNGHPSFSHPSLQLHHITLVAMLDSSMPKQYGFFVRHSSPLFNPTAKPTGSLFIAFPSSLNTHIPCLLLDRNRAHRFFLQCLPSSPLTTITQNPVSYADYLVSSLGLSHKSVLEIRKRCPIELKSTSNADSVLALFRDYGFSDTQMAKIFCVYPKLIASDPRRILKPKLDFFIHNGISGDSLAHIVTSDPNLLMRSLRRVIVPCFDFLRAFFGDGSTQAIISLLSVKGGSLVLQKFSATTAPNVAALRSCGVPRDNIVRLFLIGVRCLSRDVDEFRELVRDVIQMGFDPQSMMFIYGLRAITREDKQKVVSKMELIKKSFGWTDEEVQAFFVKAPNLLGSSEERLKKGVEVLMNRLEWTADDIAKYPTVLNYNFDNRIFPRLSVLEILMSRGLRKKTCMGYAFLSSEDVFLGSFVERYKEEIPGLLEVYEQNMRNGKT